MITAVELTTRLGDLTLPSPVMNAAGCGGSGADLGRFMDLTALGAFVTRTMTLDPRTGNAGLRLIETPSGVLTDIGFENDGLHAFLAVELPPLTQIGVRTVVSITGRSLGEYGELARRRRGAPGVVAARGDLRRRGPVRRKQVPGRRTTGRATRCCRCWPS